MAATNVAFMDLGQRIQERREALGMSKSALAAEAHVDRESLSKAETGSGHVRGSTVGAITAALDRLEHEMGLPLPEGASPVGEPESRLVEFTIEGTHGVRAIVKGPVRDLAALREAASRLIADMESTERTGSADSDQ